MSGSPQPSRLLVSTLLVLLIPLTGSQRCAAADPEELTRQSATRLAAQLTAGELSAVAVTGAYLERIAAIDDAGPRLNAIIEINPDALEIAARLDARLAAGEAPGPLHGVPVVLKANIDTGDAMATSAGSVALAGHHAGTDAFLAARLRAAGAVLIAKANLSEWANFRDQTSSSGWSSLGGQTRNPHVLDRNPCGSSSGSAVAVAAFLAPLAVGTETNGSIVCPAGVNGIVGIKPTLGIVSRNGIVPISPTQDTAGPMARSVTDAALLLRTMISADPADPLAVRYAHDPAGLLPDPTRARLDGQRIGILRAYYGAGQEPRTERIYAEAIGHLQHLGATLIDPIDYAPDDAMRESAFQVLLHEFKSSLNGYLLSHGLAPDRNTLAALIAFNEQHADTVMPIFGQSLFLLAEATGGVEDPDYARARQDSQLVMHADLAALFAEHDLDALFFPVNGPAWKTDWVAGDRYTFGGTAGLAAISGWPSIVLPAGDVAGLPIAVGFMGPPHTEPTLIQLAWNLERRLPAPLAPGFKTTLEAD